MNVKFITLKDGSKVRFRKTKQATMCRSQFFIVLNRLQENLGFSISTVNRDVFIHYNGKIHCLKKNDTMIQMRDVLGDIIRQASEEKHSTSNIVKDKISNEA